MTIEIYKSHAIPNEVLESIAQLLHESFSERREQGINFKCGNYSAQDISNVFDNGGGYLLVAKDNGQMIGTVSFVNRRKSSYKYASHDNLAVLSSYKGQGVARALFAEYFRIAKENDYDFITSVTALKAESSVRYHKKVGFVIWGKTYSKGYDSYSFIYPIKRFRVLRFEPFRWIVYLIKTGVGLIRSYN